MSTEVAIVGISVEFPGGRGLDAYWRTIAEGVSHTKPFPEARRKEQEQYALYMRQTAVEPVLDPEVEFYDGCYLDSVDQFDHSLFGMNPRQSAMTDPHQRLILRNMYTALEDAGYSLDRVRGSRTGVFVGFASNPGSSYMEYLCRIDPTLAQLALTGNVPTMIANRLSHYMDLRGPSLVVDSACSASLVAVHQAKNALLLGDCDMAVVAGARIAAVPMKHPTTRIGIESGDGVTRTFDADADGTGFGEGSGVVVLKLLDRALADGDRVYAVIKGSAVNHDGHTEGITNPDSASQARLLRAAWRNAGVDPRSVGYIEAHGTATRVGDPVEYEGIRQAFAAHTDDTGFCAVGTVKANIGHLFEGSGVLGLIKAALVLRHRKLPPLANFRTPNPVIDFERGPVFVPSGLLDWESEGPRRAGVSAFGLGGTNAHVVLEEFQGAATPTGDDRGPQLLPLSAATPSSLERLRTALLDSLDSGALDGATLADICHTAQMSRSSQRYRTAYVADDLTGLRTQLAGGPATGTGHGGERLDQLRDAFVRGETVDWSTLHQAGRPRIVDLPSYPFEDSRCGVDFPLDWKQRVGVAQADEEHPVTHVVELRPAPFGTGGTGDADEPKVAQRVLVLADTPQAEELLLGCSLGDTTVLRWGDALPDGDVRFDGSEASFTGIAEFVAEYEIEHVVHALAFESLPARDVDEIDRRVRKNLHSLFLLSKGLMNAGVKTTLSVLTHKAVAVEEGDQDPVVENASLIGFGKVISREYPYIRTKLVDVDEGMRPADLRAELLSDEYGLTVWRAGLRMREAFAELAEVETDGPDVYLQPGGLYLVTGGTGALGLEVALAFAQRQPDITLALMSRSALPDRADWDAAAAGEDRTARAVRAVREIESLGATVVVLKADAGVPDDLRDAVGTLRSQYGRINGIVHAAGLPGSSIVMFRSLKDFDDVVRPKLHGAFVLEELTADDRPEFVVHYSSVAAVFPAPGQGDYAAANYFLDNLSRARNTADSHALALDWVAWKEIGMAVDYGTNGDTIFRSLPTGTGMSVLDQGLRSRRSRIFAGEVHYRGELVQLLGSYDITLAPEVRQKLDTAVAESAERLQRAAEKVRKAIAAVDVTLTGGDGPGTDAEQLVAKCMAGAFGYSELDVEADFFELGGDSIMAASIARNIAVSFDLPFDVADIFSNRTVAEIAYHLETLRDEQL